MTILDIEKSQCYFMFFELVNRMNTVLAVSFFYEEQEAKDVYLSLK